MSDRSFVLGLDGIPWRLIRTWTNEGELPNFERVMREGAAGPFRSTTPATTPVAWPSIVTGVRPDEHGLYDFQQLTSNYSHQMNTSNDVDAPAIWDVLGPSVVANVPMTYPASEIDGTMVSGMIAPEMDDLFTYPREFRDEIRAEIPDYRISLPWGEFADDEEAFLSEFDDLVSARRDLMRLLMDRTDDWELFFFVYTAPDRLQHLFWEEDVLLEHYKELDDVLGEVLSYVEAEGGNLFIVSDHGFGESERRVHVNRLLSDAGFLARNDLSGTRGALARLGIDRSDVMSGLEKVGIDPEKILSVLPRVFVDGVAEKLPGDHVLYDVDFEETEAFMHFSGAIYVNDEARFEQGIVDPDDIPAVKRELVELLETATDPETGERPIEVSDGADLFPTDDRAPDLVVSGADDYITGNSFGDAVFEPADDMAAGHGPEGIFMAWGPDIEAGATPESATVFDFVPTLFQSLGKPIPASANGRVLHSIFAGERDAPGEEVERKAYDDEGTGTEVEDDFEEVEDRLKGLGYLG